MGTIMVNISDPDVRVEKTTSEVIIHIKRPAQTNGTTPERKKPGPKPGSRRRRTAVKKETATE